MAHPELADTSGITDLLARLRGRQITAVSRLAAVSADGEVPLLGTLALALGDGQVVLSYSQDGLVHLGPTLEPRWPTEPHLRFRHSPGAEEWLELVTVESSAVVPPVPFTVDRAEAWVGIGDYAAVTVLALADLVVTTTDGFDLECVSREEALSRAKSVAAALGSTLVHVPAE
ncbi:hypothetical protein [Actinokineospora sp. NBRC 105648]|uniref:hypothetical protein n=1 Tax=Actinokineospora sp. NBRC 105648 TaxID=3032206 RepID=UPI0024A20325|nr:hypothetical protein [Actinokineospora sp. NBRC 105648]GLZ40461.1 hypothetical protein Acsp05_40850 [Actinokineospora sp. NBRC 105648]